MKTVEGKRKGGPGNDENSYFLILEEPLDNGQRPIFNLPGKEGSVVDYVELLYSPPLPLASFTLTFFTE